MEEIIEYKSKSKTNKLGSKSCTATQAGISKRAAQAVNSHVLFAFSHLKVPLTTATRYNYESSQSRPSFSFFPSCPNLHYFPQAVSTACDCVLFRVTAVAQPKCRLTLFLPPRLFVFFHTLGGGSLHDALCCRPTCLLLLLPSSLQEQIPACSAHMAFGHTATPYSC